jgi:heme/copper-type cytochrome/quinol oxidase subunit 3
VGTVGYMVIEASMFVIVLAAYFVLFTRVPEWPPSAPNPDPTFATIGLVVLLASVIPNQMAKTAAEKLDVGRVRLLVLFWWGLVYGRYGRAAYGASALFVFVTMVHTGLLGALFALSTSAYYPMYRERAAAAGFDAVSDQQLAGLYMWVPSGIVLTVFGLALMVAWLSEADRRAGVGRKAVAWLLPWVLIPTADATVGPELTMVAHRRIWRDQGPAANRFDKFARLRQFPHHTTRPNDPPIRTRRIVVSGFSRTVEASCEDFR